MSYKRVIVDECGTVQYWGSEISQSQMIEILTEHPEWSVRWLIEEE